MFVFDLQIKIFVAEFIDATVNSQRQYFENKTILYHWESHARTCVGSVPYNTLVTYRCNILPKALTNSILRYQGSNILRFLDKPAVDTCLL